MSKPVIWTTQEDAIKHLQAQAPGKYIAIRDQRMAQSADAIMRLVQAATNWAKDPGVAVVLAWCVDALVMTVLGAPVLVSAPAVVSAPVVVPAPPEPGDPSAPMPPALATTLPVADEALTTPWL